VLIKNIISILGIVIAIYYPINLILMKNYSLLIIFGLCSAAIQAQQQVIATSGNAVDYTSGSISWTIGEPVVSTLASSDKVLNQGFQQSSLNLKAVNPDPDLKISVWPNPTINWLTLSVEKPDQILFQLFDLDGKLLQTNTLNDITTNIDFSDFISGAYQIKIVKGEKELKTITVIKQ
jgi:hypothetical protein